MSLLKVVVMILALAYVQVAQAQRGTTAGTPMLRLPVFDKATRAGEVEFEVQLLFIRIFSVTGLESGVRTFRCSLALSLQ